MGLKRIASLLVAVAALTGLAGCTNAPNVAAVVDGQVISESAVQQAGARVATLLSQDPNYANFDGAGFVLGNDILGALLTKSLADLGITITDDQRNQAWESGIDPAATEYPLWSDPVARPGMIGYVDVQLVNQMISAGQVDLNQLLAAMNQATVSVNPRYGTWDPDTLSLARNPGQIAGTLGQTTVFQMPVRS